MSNPRVRSFRVSKQAILRLGLTRFLYANFLAPLLPKLKLQMYVSARNPEYTHIDNN